LFKTGIWMRVFILMLQAAGVGYIYWFFKEVPLLFFVLVMAQVILIWRLTNHYDKAKLLLTRDRLTGAYNRGFLEEIFPKFSSLIDRKKEFSTFVYIDINNFKDINERFGTKKGDYLLANVANVLMSQSRSGDLVCRWRNDEFLLVLPYSTAVTSHVYIDRIRKSMGDLPGNIQFNFGMSVYPVDSKDMYELIDKAVKDMLKNKKKP
jgi:diguanylate cyclase (GGDEF)-like protein